MNHFAPTPPDGRVYIQTDSGPIEIPAFGYQGNNWSISAATPSLYLWPFPARDALGFLANTADALVILSDRILSLALEAQRGRVQDQPQQDRDRLAFLREVTSRPELLKQLKESHHFPKVENWLFEHPEHAFPDLLSFDRRLDLMCEKAMGRVDEFIRSVGFPTRFRRESDVSARRGILSGMTELTSVSAAHISSGYHYNGDLNVNVTGRLNIKADGGITMDVPDGQAISLAPRPKKLAKASGVLFRLWYVVSYPLRTVKWVLTGER